MTEKNQSLKNPLEDHQYFANRANYQEPTAECDFVMQGGIASGVVYPPAILSLAPKYRFRGIGGASAGAIAAGAAAAAEYGRESQSGGFVGLHEMQQELLTEGFIKSLFRPSAQTKTLYEAFFTLKNHYDKDTAQEEKRSPQGAADAVATPKDGAIDAVPFIRLWGPRITAALRAPARVGQGAEPGYGHLARLTSRIVQLVVKEVRSQGGLDPWAVFASVLAAAPALGLEPPGGLLGGVREFTKAFKALADRDESYFGFCRGSWGDGRKAGDPPQLTDWLHEGFNRLAGKAAVDAPLTIQELKDKTVRREQGQVEAVSIEFKMVTTNLSKSQPYLFPREERDLIFKRSDMCKLFPPDVVKYLVKVAEESPPRSFRLPAGYFLLPTGGDLPVVVAVRLSLSFPVLLSAVRLYSIKGETFLKIRQLKKHKQEGERYICNERDLEENWFSDGGIASNFPLTMFDSWLPLRPTFGINLRESALARDAPAPPAIADGSSVFRPGASEHAEVLPRSAPITSFPRFFMAMLDTAQNYRDNAQVMLASYRERVAQVYLAPHEGGLNLAMTAATLKAIGQKGVIAAQKLDQLDFREHLWVRTRVLMSHIEQEAFRLRDSNHSVTWLNEEYAKLIEEQLQRPEGQRWYRPTSKEWCDEALVRLGVFTAMMETWTKAQEHSEDPRFFQQKSPSPSGALRMTPKI